MNKNLSLGIFVICLISFTHLASAVVVDADYITVYPGQEGRININVDNTNDFDINDVSLTLKLENTPFNSEGSSTKTQDVINDNNDESFDFSIKASDNAAPGDYNIPYEIVYTNDDGNQTKETGSFGIRISAETDLDFAVDSQNNVIGQQGKVNLEIINRGLGEIKSISVEAQPEGMELVSKDKVFVGNIDAEDSDFVSFDVVFKSSNPTFNAIVSYKDFDNKDQTKTVSLPVKVYTQEEASSLGLTKKSNTILYLGILVAIVLIWIIWRTIRKSGKKNKE